MYWQLSFFDPYNQSKFIPKIPSANFKRLENSITFKNRRSERKKTANKQTSYTCIATGYVNDSCDQQVTNQMVKYSIFIEYLVKRLNNLFFFVSFVWLDFHFMSCRRILAIVTRYIGYGLWIMILWPLHFISHERKKKQKRIATS